MLTGRPTAAEVDATIRRVIGDLLALADRPVPALDPDDNLAATGLTSLDLAALVARLTRQWRVDPFLETLAITEVRTVGDLCRAYRDCLGTR